MGLINDYVAAKIMAVDTKELKKRAFSGVSVLILRNLLMQPISFFGFLFLSIFLKKWQLGVFWAVSEVVGFLGYFSDVGLAAAIIQKKEKPTKKELRATFTIQQVLVIGSITIALLLTPLLKRKFDFERGKFLYLMLLFGFFTSSLKTIPSVILEKKLAFKKIAIVDLMEQIVFTGLAVFLAWKGFGVNSWAWAVFFRSLAGVILIYIFSPWPLGFSLHFESVKKLFRFGVPFQINSLLAMLKDKLMNVFLWGILGSEGVGILGWAQRWAQAPLHLLMDQVVRVGFPAYSKLQNDKEKLRRALERTVSLVNLLILPVLTGMGFLMPKVVAVFPQYYKWSVGIIPFWFYLGSFAWGAITTPLVNAFNSVGRVKLTLKLMISWTALTWLLFPPLAKKFGANGAALGLFLVSSTSFVAWIIAKREFGISFKRILLTPVAADILMLASLIIFDNFLAVSILEIVLLTGVGALVYGAVAWVMSKEEIIWLVNTSKEWYSELSKQKTRT